MSASAVEAMAISPLIDVLIIGAMNTLLWILIAVRVLQRRHVVQGLPTPLRGVKARRADSVLMLVAASLFLYYVVFSVWLLRPQYAGPYLFEPAPWSAVVGVVVAVASLIIIGWTYRVFGSFRLLAQIDADHQLMTDGPFTLVRHPIYSGVMGVYVSTLFIAPSLGFLVAVCLIAVAHDLRARVEERVLRQAFGTRYTNYASRTTRFIPYLY